MPLGCPTFNFWLKAWFHPLFMIVKHEYKVNYYSHNHAMDTKVRSSQKAEALYLEIELYFVTTNLLSVTPVMRNPSASRASTVRHASLPQPLLAPDSEQKGILFH